LANNALYIASGDSNLYAYAVDLRPKLTIDPSADATQLTLRWPSETGRTNVLLFATNLSATAFLPVSTNRQPRR
jgi:hypothetical protein